MSKNYQGLESDPDEPAGGVIYEQPGSPLCPVSCFLRLIDHLNPGETALFQRPKLRIKPGSPVWFDKVPVGKNILGTMMSKISIKAGLSEVHTCHSLRATLITQLMEAGWHPLKITAITKHRDTRSLKHYYSDISHEQRSMMAQDISSAIGLPKTASSYSEATSAVPIEPACPVAHTDTIDDLDIADDVLIKYLTDIENTNAMANVSSQNVNLSSFTPMQKSILQGAVFNAPVSFNFS